MAPRRRYPPDDPREWLNRARSSLVRARVTAPEVYLEDLCYDAQQAAEKAVKGLLLARGVNHPFTHDLSALLSLVEETGIEIPSDVLQAAVLTRYAVAARYPGPARPVTGPEYSEAVTLATHVVRWVEQLL